ncbi:MAG: RsmB/NOP family class I SAM-dependent RNA methyltransferase [Rhodobacterales bacterium]|nr:RsmB/NOP family class I SAM-dependent RNA methyltransferase [Rhodobacterales bacterium]
MTPSARIETATVLLDLILAGAAAEKTLTTWARKNRFAGSKDRAAVRDHVFTALRRKRSFSALGGAMTGRAIMIGALRAEGIDPATMFNGVGYGPDPLTEAEQAAGHAPESLGERLDLPDWLIAEFQDSLGEKADENALSLRHRAPVFLRVNTAKTNLNEAVTELSLSEIEARPHPVSPTALEVTKNARRVANSLPYLDGIVELQDGSSQAVVDKIQLRDGMRILDYCAGGGGKTLALAARAASFENITLLAHDANPSRLKDIERRARRAGAQISILSKDELTENGPFDLVLCDAPCSGSGAWRRAPEGKWALTQEGLQALTVLQDEILEEAQQLVAKGGTLAYATCSVLKVENQTRISRFVGRNPDWHETLHHQWFLGDGGDGFFTSHLKRT